MTLDFVLPDLGEGLTEGEITRWLVAEGDTIAEDDPLVEIQTDKTSVEIPSPAGGTVLKLHAQEGDVVPVGAVLISIGEDTGEPHAAAVPPTGDRVRATPRVRRIAEEHGVDLNELVGSGDLGQVLETDVRAAVTAAAPLESDQERREPIRGVRRAIVQNLTASHREIPAVTFVEECDFSKIDVGLIVALSVRAAVTALQEHPELNATVQGDEIVYQNRFDIGIAVQGPDGLVVPVIRRCEQLSVEEIDRVVRRLADDVRSRALRLEDLGRSTFTISNGGRMGGVLATPMINHPQVGILGLHRIDERPVVRGDRVVIRRVGNISLTFDHRVVDGMQAAAFVLRVVEQLQGPSPD